MRFLLVREEGREMREWGAGELGEIFSIPNSQFPIPFLINENH